jgi:hypothetical protein
MGHKRINYLPKTYRWSNIVRQITEFTEVNDNASILASQVLENVKSRFKDISNDGSLTSSVKFLILISLSSKQNYPSKFLLDHGIELKGEPTPINLAKAYKKWSNFKSDSLEYTSIAQSSTIDAFSKWYFQNQTGQSNLFDTKDAYRSWEKARDGAGFCEISRLFFSKFTERYLKYFLERVASSSINSYSERNNFDECLNKHIENISLHSFETSKIAQSFAAGWFNKHARDSLPSDRVIKTFIDISLGKLRAELNLEQDFGRN